MGSVLQQSVTEGYGQNFTTVDFSTPDARMLNRLTRDVWQFSAAKNYQEMRDLTLALVNDDGKVRSFTDFKAEAQKVDSKYNSTWLKTEYDQSIGSSTMAARWVDIEQNAEDQPYLQYQTVGDSNVRHEHQLLDGIIRKITDDFWKKHFPPNGWKCRCDAIQLSGSYASETESIPKVPIDDMFATNLAQTGLIFPKGHPYYNGVPDKVIKQAVASLPNDVAYNQVYRNAENGKNVEMHIYHGIDEMKGNMDIAKFLANNGYNVKLLPVIDKEFNNIRESLFGKGNYRKGKNADALVNKKVFEFKSITGSPTHKNIQRHIYKASKQAENIYIKLPEAINTSNIDRSVNGIFNQSKSIKEVWIDNGGEIIKKQNGNYIK